MQTLGFRIVAWVAFFYAAMLLLTATFDSLTARLHKTVSFYRDYPYSIYANTAHYAAYGGLNRLDGHPKQVFIFGASETARGFDPDLLTDGLPGYKVHNLSVSGSNATQMEQVIDLLYSRVNWKHLDSAIFVFGGHFLSFLENERKFGGETGGLTKIEVEELRHHLYTNDGGVIKAELRPEAMATALFLMKPFVLVYKIKFEVDELISRLEDGFVSELKTLIGSHAWKNTSTDPPDKASYYRALRSQQLRNEGLADEQFALFIRLAARLHADGAKVVFVGVPVPSYFRKGFSVYDEYRRKEADIIRDPRVDYLDLTTVATDAEFIDDGHPREEFSAKWTGSLLLYLQGLCASKS